MNPVFRWNSWASVPQPRANTPGQPTGSFSLGENPIPAGICHHCHQQGTAVPLAGAVTHCHTVTSRARLCPWQGLSLIVTLSPAGHGCALGRGCHSLSHCHQQGTAVPLAGAVTHCHTVTSRARLCPWQGLSLIVTLSPAGHGCALGRGCHSLSHCHQQGTAVPLAGAVTHCHTVTSRARLCPWQGLSLIVTLSPAGHGCALGRGCHSLSHCHQQGTAVPLAGAVTHCHTVTSRARLCPWQGLSLIVTLSPAGHGCALGRGCHSLSHCHQQGTAVPLAGAVTHCHTVTAQLCPWQGLSPIVTLSLAGDSCVPSEPTTSAGAALHTTAISSHQWLLVCFVCPCPLC
ncbi:PREDICTED: uncharacterized protein LOC101819107 [Ficedula albicollis]|uniref:uncharacterized protein LOC101819107 n=1 Tax=Ficedula albicollis TaxID=59894 RepID=UPI000359C8C0|nr:PREDICTED: uncharacterized protein LOC101819107 [Ficedula albicollis]